MEGKRVFSWFSHFFWPVLFQDLEGQFVHARIALISGYAPENFKVWEELQTERIHVLRLG